MRLLNFVWVVAVATILGTGVAQAASHSTLLHYTVNGKNQDIDLKPFVGFGNYSVNYMVDPESGTLYLLKNSWDTTKIIAIPESSAGQWDQSQGKFLMNFGRRSFWNYLYNPVDKNFYVITDVENNENTNVWRLNPRTRSLKQVTHEGYTGAYSLSPRSDSIYYIARNLEAGLNATPCLEKISVIGHHHNRKLLCTPGDRADQVYMYENPRANPQESVVALTISEGNSYNKLNLGLLDLRTGKLEVVTDRSTIRMRMSILGWKGSTVYVIHSENAVDPTVNGSESLYKYNVDTKQMTLLLANEASMMEASDFDPKTGHIFLKESGSNANGADVSKILIYDTNNESVLNTYDLPGFTVYDSFTSFLNGGQIMFSAQGGNDFNVDVVDQNVTATQGGLKTVISIQQNLASPCATEELHFPTFDTPQTSTGPQENREIEGVLFKPAIALQSGAAPAAVILAHGGPGDRTRAEVWDAETELLCHLGYYVFGVNPRGSTGFDAAWPGFSTLADKDWGGGDFKDYVYGRRFLAQKYNIPLDRIGITGGSYGGYMTNWAITQKDPSDPGNDFPWAISFYGMSDLLADLSITDVPFDTITSMGDPNASDAAGVAAKARYINRSPLTYASQVTGPLLLVHGQNDHRVPVQNSDLFDKKLVELGKGSLVTYVQTKGDGHGFFYMNTELEAYQAVLDFLVKYAPVETAPVR